MKSQDSYLHDDILLNTSTRLDHKEDLELQRTATSSNANEENKKALWGLIDPKLIRKIIAEAIGTFMLMFCIGGIIANLHIMGIETGLLEYAATAGLTVIVVVFSSGTISGGHVNPAVTIAFATVGPFPWSQVPLYVLGQVGGSVLATYSGQLVYGLKPGIVMTVPLHGSKAAFFVEFIATFIILFLITSLISESQQPKESSGFVVGVAIALGVLITGPISGASMNPARSLGPALVSWRFDHLWIYLVAPTLGAISGVATYRILRLKGWSSCDFVRAQKALQVNHSSLY